MFGKKSVDSAIKGITKAIKDLEDIIECGEKEEEMIEDAITSMESKRKGVAIEISRANNVKDNLNKLIEGA